MRLAVAACQRQLGWRATFLIFACWFVLACTGQPLVGGDADAGDASTGTNPQCPAGALLCDQTCVDPTRDATHCGSCATQCASDEACVDGQCTTNCPAEFSLCGGACVDTRTDIENCGACGTLCGSGTVCSLGQCELTCGGGLVTCSSGGGTNGDGGGSDYCADLNSDRENCGACANACGVGQQCLDGNCTYSCPPGETVCNASCADLQTDPANCGSCGVACANGEACQAGSCVTQCSPGL
ncbi:MAG: hypothetical protein KC492_25450, partial [Myxococcales bacterium]|nr:hypothetical protein [Myxococcales bacterium]